MKQHLDRTGLYPAKVRSEPKPGGKITTLKEDLSFEGRRTTLRKLNAEAAKMLAECGGVGEVDAKIVGGGHESRYNGIRGYISVTLVHTCKYKDHPEWFERDKAAYLAYLQKKREKLLKRQQKCQQQLAELGNSDG